MEKSDTFFIERGRFLQRNLPIMIGLILIAAVAGGCGAADDSSAGKEIGYEMRHFEKTFGICDTASRPCLTITADYPVFSTEPTALADSINESVTAFLLPQPDSGDRVPDLETFSRNMISEYQQLSAEFPDYVLPWFISKEAVVLTDTAELVVLRFYESSYTGGAHPNSVQSYANFDIRTGSCINLPDIFIDDYLRPLTDTAEVLFREMIGLSPSEHLGDAGYWFDENTFALNDNFAIGDTSLIFFYNSYEIAPYAAGPTRLLIPYTRIEHLIRDDGPLAFAK